ncbi:MAG: hypothetical protein JNK88_12015 [Mangrovicoccus sp.]|nr:hypothetical protein [Mangrovicoccus sp.]
MTTATPHATRQMAIEAVIAAILLALAFVAIAASDVSAMRSNGYWLGLVVVFALVSYGFDRVSSGGRWVDLTALTRTAVHWLGVLAAIELVHVFVQAGQMTNADTGLACGLILALGAFTAGAWGNWRMGILGLALGVATAVVALIEQYLWVLLAVALVAVAVMLLVARMRRASTGA